MTSYDFTNNQRRREFLDAQRTADKFRWRPPVDPPRRSALRLIPPPACDIRVVRLDGTDRTG
jgi:hypothetical protein